MRRQANHAVWPLDYACVAAAKPGPQTTRHNTHMQRTVPAGAVMKLRMPHACQVRWHPHICARATGTTISRLTDNDNCCLPPRHYHYTTTNDLYCTHQCHTQVPHTQRLTEGCVGWSGNRECGGRGVLNGAAANSAAATTEVMASGNRRQAPSSWRGGGGSPAPCLLPGAGGKRGHQQWREAGQQQ